VRLVRHPVLAAVVTGDPHEPRRERRNGSPRASRLPAESYGLLINRRDQVHPGVDRKPSTNRAEVFLK
jgi:hypothetical protein